MECQERENSHWTEFLLLKKSVGFVNTPIDELRASFIQWLHQEFEWELSITCNGIPIPNSNGDVIAAQMLIYPGDPVEEYHTFCTPEAYNELKSWMRYREDCGEKISGESWVMRDIWQTHGMDYGAQFGLAENPKKLDAIAVKRIIERGL